MPMTKHPGLTVAADAVGAVSTALGSFLTVAPLKGGRWLGLADTEVGRRRALGTADLALGLTILAGRSSRWRWRAVATRSLLHLLFAREYVRNGSRGGAAAMAALFVIDAGNALGLRASGRASEARFQRRSSRTATCPERG